jgi:hypothetical protein
MKVRGQRSELCHSFSHSTIDRSKTLSSVFYHEQPYLPVSRPLYSPLKSPREGSIHCFGRVTLMACTAHISLFPAILSRHPAAPPTRLHPSNGLRMADHRLLHAGRRHQKAKARGRHLHRRRRRDILRLLETSNYGAHTIRSAQTTTEQYAPSERHAHYSGAYEKAPSFGSRCREYTLIRRACTPTTTHVYDSGSTFVEGSHTESTADCARTAGACEGACWRW